MNWFRVFRELGKFLIIFALIPTIFVVKWKWDGILPTIIYFQLLLIWIQGEINLRQSNLFALQYEPYFNVKPYFKRTEELGGLGMAKAWQSLSIKNISKNPTYGISVERILDRNYRSIPPEKWRDKVIINDYNVLPPGEERPLIEFEDIVFLKEFHEQELSIEVGYLNILNEWKSFCIRGTKRSKTPVIFLPFQKQPGFLLNTFENIATIFKYLKYSKFKK